MPDRSTLIRQRYENAESRYIEVDGRRIHYRIEGQGPTLFLLHGLLASLHTWDGWVEELKSSYRLIRLDLPGFGLSDHHLEPEQYGPDHSIALFEKVRAALQVERFSMAGNSLGGFVSWYYAVHHPERVDKLILLDPIAYPQKLPPLIAWLALPVFGEISYHFSPRFMVAYNLRRVYGDARLLMQETIDRYHALMTHGANRMAMVHTFRKLKELSSNPELSKNVARLRTPTMLMWGSQDRWVPPALIAHWQRDVPQLELKVYEGIGHLPMEEIPVETARDAHAFLSRETARPATTSSLA